MTTTTHTRRDGEATRQRLLRAALELYTTVGFRATTTPAIAARAGVAEGTIYRHFSGKEHLLNEVYRGAQRWGAGLVRDSDGERPLPATERLRSIGQRLLGAAAGDPSLARMLLRSREEQHLDERSREASREFRGALQQVIEGAKSDGVVRAGPPDLWTDVWLALVGFAAERLSAGEWPPDSPHVGLTLDAAWDAIAAR
ncbi:MAG TPA: TetR/AcrR family transcriptional regulator [Gemmatimonadales bacterium]|nr:TetR/AcrR family transcriptional regulator [Gemmatimonadales bacterium]